MINFSNSCLERRRDTREENALSLEKREETRESSGGQVELPGKFIGRTEIAVGLTGFALAFGLPMENPTMNGRLDLDLLEL